MIRIETRNTQFRDQVKLKQLTQEIQEKTEFAKRKLAELAKVAADNDCQCTHDDDLNECTHVCDWCKLVIEFQTLNAKDK